ncbi:MAG: exodeoxyribonuclease VII large subunit [Methanophagales archaeon]|nr:exodeoxyribonuclease VII large subunit [Methanophagales archaeon]MCW7069628.1 exodeoxyribonuclease VII large subunit [Methanophagales archaeon]MCW7073763.1 exodeoxyribonuclease VII large subunit [Methanophagales archaeon]
MVKPKITLLDFLHLKKEDDTAAAVIEEDVPGEGEVGEGEEKEKEKTHTRIYSVWEITRYIRQKLDSDELLRDIYIKGELSNVSQPTSGHVYFTLKDEYSELRCVMFRNRNALLKFTLEDGMSVIVRGHISVYEKRGRYQLYVEELQESGIGALYRAFEQLKKKLKDEGMFDATHKKPIPVIPHTIGIITSPTGAAIRDMINITRRRFPHVHILLAPVAVQGEEAAPQIVNAIKLMNRVNRELEKVDVLVVGRGGGSIEELWAFNEESVARAIFASEIPVISAVGHETDFTISDFVADRRAATPSEAAELVVPDKRQIEKNMSTLELQLRQNIYKLIEQQRRRLESIEKNVLFRKPTERINQYRQMVDEVKRTLIAEVMHRVQLHRKGLQALTGKLDALSPRAILERGYSICLKEQKVVRSVMDISTGDMLRILFRDGEAISEVKEKKHEEA